MRHIVVLSLLVLIVLSSPSFGAVPRTISYQGILTNEAGQPVGDGDFNISFRLYTSETGGTPLWSETQSVTVHKGVFNVILPSAGDLPIAFDEQYWLGVSVGGNPELTPRTKLTASAYAIMAFDADMLDGEHGSHYAAQVHNHDDLYYGKATLNAAGTINDATNPVDWTKLKGVPPGFADGTDNIGSTADGYSLDADDGNPTDAVYVDGNGNVGVGKTNPQARLDVTGSPTYGYIGGSLNAVYGQNTPSSTYGLLGGPDTGVFGYSFNEYGVQGVSHEGYAIHGAVTNDAGTAVYGAHRVSNNEGYLGGLNYAVYGHPGNASSYAGYFDGKVRLAGFELPTGAGAGRVLTSDASGVGTWQTPPAGIGGSGNANYIPKFSASATVGNSVLFQSGSSIGLGTIQPSTTLDINGACRVMNDIWPTEGKGMELVYDPNQHKGYVQVFDRGTSTWGRLFLGHGTVGIGTTDPDTNVKLHVVNQADYTYAQLAGGSHGVWAENTAQGSKGYVAGVGYGVYAESVHEGLRAYNPYRNTDVILAGDNVAVKAFNNTMAVETYLADGSDGVWTRNILSTFTTMLARQMSAADFFGPVNIYGDLTKPLGSFKIDHPLDPENKYLFHSFVESPDMMNVYNGNVTLDARGEAWVELPDWFEALNKDFRYQLTCIGGFAPVYIAEKVSGNRFKIAGGTAGLEVSWQVTGIRHDAYADAHRIQVEQDKRPEDRGKYLYPKELGRPETMGINYQDLSGKTRPAPSKPVK
jgi:hypothetical protein